MRWLVLVMFALLPLQWFALVTTPVGQLRLHQVAMLGMAAIILSRYRLRVYAPVLRVSRIFLFASIYLLAAIVAVAAYRDSSYGASAQQLFYLITFIALAGLICRVASGDEPRVLGAFRLAAPILCLSLLIGFSVAMIVNGVNPAAVFARSIAEADPEIFQQEVFKSAFAGFGLDEEMVKGNLRHEIFGSVLLSMLISTWAVRVGTTPSRRVLRMYQSAMVLGVVLLTLSLSRSILIAAVVWPLLVVFRSARRGELSTRQVAISFASVGAVGVVLLSGLGGVLANRFINDTTGYESRLSNYSGAFAAIPDHWVTGGFDTAGVSSHNFVIDTLLRSGVFAFVPALIILVTLLVAFALLVARLHELPPAMVPVVAALALPLVRAGTSGGGQIPPVEWVALAFVAGVVAALRFSQQPGQSVVADQAPVGAGV